METLGEILAEYIRCIRDEENIPGELLAEAVEFARATKFLCESHYWGLMGLAQSLEVVGFNEDGTINYLCPNDAAILNCRASEVAEVILAVWLDDPASKLCKYSPNPETFLYKVMSLYDSRDYRILARHQVVAIHDDWAVVLLRRGSESKVRWIKWTGHPNEWGRIEKDVFVTKNTIYYSSCAVIDDEVYGVIQMQGETCFVKSDGDVMTYPYGGSELVYNRKGIYFRNGGKLWGCKPGVKEFLLASAVDDDAILQCSQEGVYLLKKELSRPTEYLSEDNKRVLSITEALPLVYKEYLRLFTNCNDFMCLGFSGWYKKAKYEIYMRPKKMREFIEVTIPALMQEKQFITGTSGCMKKLCGELLQMNLSEEQLLNIMIFLIRYVDSETKKGTAISDVLMMVLSRGMDEFLKETE